MNFAVQIFRGLAYIHSVPGVCHRDVKPQNLLVSILLSFLCSKFYIRLFSIERLVAFLLPFALSAG